MEVVMIEEEREYRSSLGDVVGFTICVVVVVLGITTWLLLRWLSEGHAIVVASVTAICVVLFALWWWGADIKQWITRSLAHSESAEPQPLWARIISIVLVVSAVAWITAQVVSFLWYKSAMIAPFLVRVLR